MSLFNWEAIAIKKGTIWRESCLKSLINLNSHLQLVTGTISAYKFCRKHKWNLQNLGMKFQMTQQLSRTTEDKLIMPFNSMQVWYHGDRGKIQHFITETVSSILWEQTVTFSCLLVECYSYNTHTKSLKLYCKLLTMLRWKRNTTHSHFTTVTAYHNAVTI